MTGKILNGLVCGTLGVAFSALCSVTASADVNSAREFELSWDLCGASTQAVEQATNLPRHLLAAIAVAESGRRDDLNKIVVAWPWTVTSGSEEWYADSKREAIEVVEDLVRNGVRNIDVGCMQINLYYHSDAFKTLDEAFDPLTNVSYAAAYLTKLRKRTSNWMTAAGNYHSATPEFHNRYRARLKEIWDRERRGLNRVASTDTMQAYYSTPNNTTPNTMPNSMPNSMPSGSTFSEVPPVDIDRTAEINQAFRTRQQEEAAAAELLAAETGAGPISASALGDSWKAAYTSGGDANYALQAQMNRLRKAADEQDMLERMLREDANNLAAKRAADLDAWRKLYNKTLTDSSTSSTSLF